MKRRLRNWQRFLIIADEDLLAFAILYEGDLMGHAFYYAGQAIEKYLKALVLKTRQRQGLSVALSRKKNKWLFTHGLLGLAQECSGIHPFYSTAATKRDLADCQLRNVVAVSGSSLPVQLK